ncbi:olfactory receptor 14A16-like [Varanus komodoensis]|uniref:olfactory receptor 14A16-like n=1 Tax=Varanus komodoensis TaxID=61221 RepID=UPI001CF7B025|nr:olfactory receptor 14A16-like [Varanus komodoensis]
MILNKKYLFNESSFSEFLLLEFSNTQEIQMLYFIGFFVFYLAAVAGKLIISGVASDHHLHTPMYFFLMNLAMQDVGQVSVIFPKAMANSLMNGRHISYAGCVAQVLFFLFFLASDFFLLTVMAYDRLVAICNPLQYEMLMNKQSCIQMVSAVWIFIFLYGVLHSGGTFASPFCSNVINQFFCEIPALLKVVCSDLYIIEIGVLFLGAIVWLCCFIFIVVTYMHIFTAVLQIPSTQGKKKAFSTCLPHLIVCSIFIITGDFAYLKPTSNSASFLDLAFTMIYSIVPPLLNPVIYSMRNKELKRALSKLLGTRSFRRNNLSIPVLQR